MTIALQFVEFLQRPLAKSKDAVKYFRQLILDFRQFVRARLCVTLLFARTITRFHLSKFFQYMPHFDLSITKDTDT